MIKKNYLRYGIIAFVFIFCFALVIKQLTQGLFNSSQISQSFSSYVTKEIPSAKLVVFEVFTVEKIERKEKLSFLWRLISLSDLSAEILVPVHYSFFIDLNEGFQLLKEGDKLVVQAPALKSHTPAVDVSAISFKVNDAPFLYNTHKIEKEFYAQLTNYLNQQSEVLKQSYTLKSSDSLKRVVLNWLAINNYDRDINSEDIVSRFLPAQVGPR